MFILRVSKVSAYCKHNRAQYELKCDFCNNDKQYLHAFSYLHKHYEQSGADVDFVGTYEKIGATEILMNAKIHVNFLQQTVNANSFCSRFMNETL